MRIVHVLLTSRFAGTERHVVDLVAAQADAGHEVSLVLRRKAAQDRPDAVASRVDPRVRLELVADWLARWPAVPQARRRVQALAPDIVHAHLGSACRAMRGITGCPRVSTLHICYKPAHHAHLDGLIAIAPWQLEAVPKPLRDHTVQIDNWTVPRPPTEGARERLRAQAGLREDEYVVGALGRIEPGKGMDVLVEAFQQADLPGARLVIVGHGRAWEAVRRQAPADVVMPGFATRPEDWLAAFDCFVSPARNEPFGLVLLEAMQAGLPVVATASEGAKHLAQMIGRPLVPIDDAPALAGALGQVHREGPRRQTYALEGYRVANKAREVDRFYESLLAQRRS